MDSLIAYSKRDRDGKVDAYLACYRPDEVVLLLFRVGELVNAAILTPSGRFPVAIGEALRHIAAEPERSEMLFAEVPQEQLAAMFAACVQEPQELGLNPRNPELLFRPLLERQWSGTLELISNTRLNYIQVRAGRFAGGMFADIRPGEAPAACVARLFAAAPGQALPTVSVKAFAGLGELPHQASPALLQVFRTLVWDVTEAAGREMGDAAKRAERVRQKLLPQHEVLQTVGGPRGTKHPDPVIEPERLAEAVAQWASGFLGELEIVYPQFAARLIRDAAREQRFALNAVGFFDRLPWRISW